MIDFLLPQKLPRLEAALRDAKHGAADSRWVAALALGQIRGRDQETATRMLIELLEDPVEGIRAQALEGLTEQARGGVSVEEQVVLDGLGDRSAAVRCTAVDAALAILSDPLHSLVPLVEDEDPSVRAAVAAALGDLPLPFVADSLHTLLDDADPIVRFETAVSLAGLGDAAGEDLLIDSLRNDKSHAFAASFALGKLGSVKALPALDKLTRSLFSPIELKAMAAAAVVRCSNDAEARECLWKLSSSRSANKRFVFLTTLSSLPVSGMIECVSRLITSGDQAEASAGLRSMTAIASIEPELVKRELESLKGQMKGELSVELEECLRSI